MPGRNGRGFKVPELPHFSVYVYCPDTRTIYEFLGCHWHGHTCQPFRDVRCLGRTVREDNGAHGADYTSGLPGQSSMGM